MVLWQALVWGIVISIVLVALLVGIFGAERKVGRQSEAINLSATTTRGQSPCGCVQPQGDCPLVVVAGKPSGKTIASKGSSKEILKIVWE